MEKIIKPSEYAKELGISRQAVYAKIKRGILKSKDIDGKLYIVVEDSVTKKVVKKPTVKETQVDTQHLDKISSTSYKELLNAKDETISVLKSTISDLKDSNKEISTTLRSEIDLLKEAFYEMRNLYTNQLEHHPSKVDTIEIEHHQAEEISPEEITTHKWISVKKFCKYYNIKDKKIDKYNKIFKKLYKKSDERVIISDDKYKVDILQDFSDIVIY